MKNTHKKKITRNYHLLTKVEPGKCRRVTAAIDVICINSGGIQTNAQIGKQFFPARKRLVEQCYIISHKWWSLKKKYFPNRHTVLAVAWSELWGHDWIPSRWPPEGHCRLVIPRACDLTWLIFGLILLLSDGKSLRLNIFGLKRNWNKRNSFLNSIR